LTHWITSYATAGQYFDRPSPQVLAKQTGDNRSITTTSSSASSSLGYTWNLVRVRFLNPILKHTQYGNQGISGDDLISIEDTSHTQPHPFRVKNKKGEIDSASNVASAHTGMTLWLRKALLMWNMSSPLVHVGVAAITLICYTWKLPFANYLLPFSNVGRNDTEYVWFRKTEKPAWSEVLFVISVPTVISLLVYTRLINPIPDLVAGSNVLKAVRNEAKAFGVASNVSIYCVMEDSTFLCSLLHATKIFFVEIIKVQGPERKHGSSMD